MEGEKSQEAPSRAVARPSAPAKPIASYAKTHMKSTFNEIPAVLEEMQVSPEELKGAAQVKTDDFCLRTNDVKYRGQDCSGSLVIHPSLGGRPTGVS